MSKTINTGKYHTPAELMAIKENDYDTLVNLLRSGFGSSDKGTAELAHQRPNGLILQLLRVFENLKPSAPFLLTTIKFICFCEYIFMFVEK